MIGLTLHFLRDHVGAWVVAGRSWSQGDRGVSRRPFPPSPGPLCARSAVVLSACRGKIIDFKPPNALGPLSVRSVTVLQPGGGVLASRGACRCQGALGMPGPDRASCMPAAMPLGFLQDWTVPQKWFWHFYAIGAAWNPVLIYLTAQHSDGSPGVLVGSLAGGLTSDVACHGTAPRSPGGCLRWRLEEPVRRALRVCNDGRMPACAGHSVLSCEGPRPHPSIPCPTGCAVRAEPVRGAPRPTAAGDAAPHALPCACTHAWHRIRLRPQVRREVPLRASGVWAWGGRANLSRAGLGTCALVPLRGAGRAALTHLGREMQQLPS